MECFVRVVMMTMMPSVPSFLYLVSSSSSLVVVGSLVEW